MDLSDSGAKRKNEITKFNFVFHITPESIVVPLHDMTYYTNKDSQLHSGFYTATVRLPYEIVKYRNNGDLTDVNILHKLVSQLKSYPYKPETLSEKIQDIFHMYEKSELNHLDIYPLFTNQDLDQLFSSEELFETNGLFGATYNQSIYGVLYLLTYLAQLNDQQRREVYDIFMNKIIHIRSLKEIINDNNAEMSVGQIEHTNYFSDLNRFHSWSKSDQITTAIVYLCGSILRDISADQLSVEDNTSERIMEYIKSLELSKPQLTTLYSFLLQPDKQIFLDKQDYIIDLYNYHNNKSNIDFPAKINSKIINSYPLDASITNKAIFNEL